MEEIKEQEVTVTFDELGLSEETLAAVKKKGFVTPSPIQAATIPLLLKRERDIIGQASTGTGKTAAFGLPILETLDRDSRNVQALILAPTRELAIQVADEIQSLCVNYSVKVVAVYGGQPIDRQIRDIRNGAQIVVGTPGRIIDHLKRRTLKLGEISHLVLDEADEMLNMGFVEDIEEIIEYTNEEKQVMLFSATMPNRIRQLAERYMGEYDMVKVKSKAQTTDLTDQLFYVVRYKDKDEGLCRLIESESAFYGIVFCRTRNDVDMVAQHLQQRGYKSDGLHGDISQAQREKILRKLKKRQINILVATDVAARGIDINSLTHVVNYSLPQNSETYVHRIGRTGRAGNRGTAVTFVTHKEISSFKHYQRELGIRIPEQKLPGVGEIIARKKEEIRNNLTAILETEKQERHIDFARELLAAGDPEQVVAGMLKYSFHRELEPSHYRDLGAPDHKRSDDRDRGERRSGRDDRHRDDRKSGSTQRMTRLFVFKGAKDGLNARKLVNLLTQDNNVNPRSIDRVEVSEVFSFVSAPAADADAIIDTFKADGSKRPIVERAKEKGSARGGDRDRGGDRGGRFNKDRGYRKDRENREERGGYGRGGERSDRAGRFNRDNKEGGDRGGERSDRGGDRGGRSYDRSDRGGERSDRGSDRGGRSYDRSDRGGERSDRGGRSYDRSDRGGERSDRGGRSYDRSDRGGERSDRGGRSYDRSDRGGDRGGRSDRAGRFNNDNNNRKSPQRDREARSRDNS